MNLPVVDYERAERLSVPSTKPIQLGNMIALGLLVLCVLYLFFRRAKRKKTLGSS